MIPALLIRLRDAKRDPALGSSGDRKHLVPTIYPDSETPALQVEWLPPAPGELCPVSVVPDMESATFTEQAKQTRHMHRRATEVYIVLEGSMRIEVQGTEYLLAAGDMIIVYPGAPHEVKREGCFLCRVITCNCAGAADRFDVPA